MSCVSLTPVRIASGAVQLSAMLYAPPTAEATSDIPPPTVGRVLVACPPLAEERKGSVRPLSELARILAGRGWRVLLFDYAGTGDSPGDFSTTTWESLCADTTAAIEFAGNLPEAREVSLLGLRLGARVALESAAGFISSSTATLKIATLIFWEPVLDGKAWLRETRRRSRFRQGDANRDAPENDLDGYLYADSLIETLTGMDTEVVAENFFPKTTAFPALHLLTLTAGGQATAGMKKIAAHLGVSPRPIRLPPFWLENAVLDYRPLLDETLACFAERKLGESR